MWHGEDHIVYAFSGNRAWCSAVTGRRLLQHCGGCSKNGLAESASDPGRYSEAAYRVTWRRQGVGAVRRAALTTTAAAAATSTGRKKEDEWAAIAVAVLRDGCRGRCARDGTSDRAIMAAAAGERNNNNNRSDATRRRRRNGNDIGRAPTAVPRGI